MTPKAALYGFWTAPIPPASWAASARAAPWAPE
jgi:hypothetical protein